MGAYLVSAILFFVVWLLLKDIIDGWREYKRRKRLDLYRRAELIGRKRLDGCVTERSKVRF